MSPEDFFLGRDVVSSVLAARGLVFQDEDMDIYEGAAEGDPISPMKAFHPGESLHGNDYSWGVAAIVDGEVAGLAAVSEHLHSDGSCSLFLDAIHVRPQDRGRGIAAAMVGAMEEVFSARLSGMSVQALARSEIACEGVSPGGVAIASRFERFTENAKAGGDHAPE